MPRKPKPLAEATDDEIDQKRLILSALEADLKDTPIRTGTRKIGARLVTFELPEEASVAREVGRGDGFVDGKPHPPEVVIDEAVFCRFLYALQDMSNEKLGHFLKDGRCRDQRKDLLVRCLKSTEAIGAPGEVEDAIREVQADLPMVTPDPKRTSFQGIGAKGIKFTSRRAPKPKQLARSR